jgi:hypothetical protein
MSDSQPIDLNSSPLGIGRHVSCIADPFNGHIDWNNMSNPGTFAVAGTEEQEGGEPPPVSGAGLVVCLLG